MKSPNPGSENNIISGVSAASPGSVWAVGNSVSVASSKVLILHWTGSAWKHVTGPSPNNEAVLDGVRVLSACNAWAVGSYRTATGSSALVEHWNGHARRRVSVPSPGKDAQLNGVTPLSATNAWAVGSFSSSPEADRTLILHWNGRSWKKVPSPSPGDLLDDFLVGVAAGSARSAWAVGTFTAKSGFRALVLHWNGRSWTQLASPAPGRTDNELFGLGAAGPNDMWAVGTLSNDGSVGRALAIHCC